MGHSEIRASTMLTASLETKSNGACEAHVTPSEKINVLEALPGNGSNTLVPEII